MNSIEAKTDSAPELGLVPGSAVSGKQLFEIGLAARVKFDGRDDKCTYEDLSRGQHTAWDEIARFVNDRAARTVLLDATVTACHAAQDSALQNIRRSDTPGTRLS